MVELYEDSECRKCALLGELYGHTPKTPRDYWLLTELFLYLHDGKDYCTGGKEEVPEDITPDNIDRDWIGDKT